jgi:hypothetical protein
LQQQHQPQYGQQQLPQFQQYGQMQPFGQPQFGGPQYGGQQPPNSFPPQNQVRLDP